MTSLPGRGQPLDAPILTAAGWSTIGDLHVGDQVLDAHGDKVNVVEMTNETAEDVCRVRLSDDSVVECARYQIWKLRRGSGSRVEICFFPLERMRNARTAYYLEPIRPLDFPDLDLPLEPYLLGALIGDGGFSNKQVYFSTGEAEMIDLLRPLIPNGVSLLQRDVFWWALATRCCGRPNPVIAALRQLGLMGKRAERKSIPTEYKRASLTQRNELLQGLMDTDGCESSGKPPAFATVSDQLAEDVRELVRSMGGTARMATTPGTVLPLHRLSISVPAGIKPFRLARKAARYDRQGYSLLARRIVSIELLGVRPVRAIVVDSPTGAYVSNNYVPLLDGLSFGASHVKRISALVRRSALTTVA